MIHSMNNKESRAIAKSGAIKAPVKALSAALAAAVAAACLVLAPTVSSAADAKKPEISRVIAKEMTAAMKALQAQQWQEAIKNLEAANQKSGLTAIDKKSIHDYEGYAYIHLSNFKMAQQEYEAALATGAYSPEEAAKTTRTLFRLAAQNQQYAKAIDFGKQVSDSGAATGDDLGVMAQLYYLQKDCKDSAVWADKAIAAARKAGEAPKENLYQFKLQCASDAGDTAAMDGILTDLIKLTNKTTYWNTLLRIERQDERDDHNTLMIYRIMYNTNSMNADTDYIEMAQLLGDAALPGEAAAVLDKAMSTGVIKDEHKERTTRLLAALKGRADTDKKGLPQQETEANKNAAGELLVKLGEVYYGFGDYQKTADSINQALQKGQIKHQDEAYVYLALADVQLKNTADAKKALAKLKDVPNISPRVLKLWTLYAATLGMSAG
jgi:tetratricopeptide (TPR) repeat protein